MTGDLAPPVAGAGPPPGAGRPGVGLAAAEGELVAARPAEATPDEGLGDGWPAACRVEEPDAEPVAAFPAGEAVTPPPGAVPPDPLPAAGVEATAPAPESPAGVCV
ncbi:MAG TPA: hypothetical protein VKX24_09655 [Acidimicrobiia bacterium]|nr:hypothetical protein [Acidimicrobiia bacterium]